MNQTSTNPESKWVWLTDGRAVREENCGDEYAKLVRQMMLKADECQKQIIKTTMDSIIGYAQLKEDIDASLIFPREFNAARVNSKPIYYSTSSLFFGAPRGVKTMLAFALANKLNYSMISLRCSDILDDSFREYTVKMKAAFAAAVKKGPCILFLEGIESYLQERSQTMGHWVFAQVGEFKVQCDILKRHNKSNPKQEVILVAATNRPEIIDEAVRQRIQYYFHVHLPKEDDRKLLLQYKLVNDITHEFSSKEWSCILAKTNGYTSLDFDNLISDVNSMLLRKKIRDIRTPCSETAEGAVSLSINEIYPADLELEKITAGHIIFCSERRAPFWDVNDENGPVKACERFNERFGNTERIEEDIKIEPHDLEKRNIYPKNMLLKLKGRKVRQSKSTNDNYFGSEPDKVLPGRDHSGRKKFTERPSNDAPEEDWIAYEKSQAEKIEDGKF